MNGRRLFVFAFWLNCLAVSATAETRVFSAGSCHSHQPSYLLAANSGALIRVQAGSLETINDHVIVFRPKPTTGWASQRLLMRFDLKIEDGRQTVRNTGAFCEEEK